MLNAHGDHLFEQGLYKPAAAIFSQSDRSFESVALLFLGEEKARDALKDFLRRRLEGFARRSAGLIQGPDCQPT